MAIQTRSSNAGSAGNAQSAQSHTGGGGHNQSGGQGSNQKPDYSIDLASWGQVKTKLNPGNAHTLNAENADLAWEQTGPPPAGDYDLKLFPGRASYDFRTAGDDSSIFYKMSVECRVVNNPDYDNTPIFSNVSTRVQRGKDISTMAALLVKMGFSGAVHGKTLTDQQVMGLFISALSREVIINGNSVDWRGSYQDSKTGKWVNLYKSMTDFPVDADEPSGHKWQVTHYDSANVPQDITAQAQVVKWGSKDARSAGGSRRVEVTEVVEEEVSTTVNQSTVNQASTLAPAMKPVQQTKPNGKTQTQAQTSRQAPAPTPTPVAPVQDDDALLEELAEA